MDDTRTADEGSIQPAPPVPSAVDNSWWGMLLTLLVLLGIATAIFGLWWVDRQQRARSIEQYLPIGTSAAQSFLTSSPTGAQSYRAINISRYDGLGALNLMPIMLQAQVVAATLGIPADDVTADIYGDFLKNGSTDLVVAQELGTQYSATGPFTVTNALYLVGDTDIALLALDGKGLDPAAVILDIALQPGAERTSRGMFDGTLPYTFTVQLEGHEAITAPLGSFDDCLRVRQTFHLGDASEQYHSWYCAGIGLVRQETLTADAQVRETSELISAAGPQGGIAGTIAPIRNQAAAGISQRVVQPEGPIALGATWSYREPGSNTMHITSPATFTDDAILFGTVSGRVVAIDRQTHQAKWRFNTGGAVYGAPAVGGGVVLVGSIDRYVYALDAETGAFRWAVRTGDAITGGAVIRGDTAYIGSEDHRLYAFDLVSGAERWHFDTEGPIAATPTIAGDSVYVGSDDGALYALDAGSGELRWAFATDNAVASSPVVTGDSVYIGSHDGLVYALARQPDSREGQLLWTRDTLSSIETDLVLTDGLLIAQTSDDEVYGLDPHTGEPRWIYRSERSLRGAPLLFGDQLLLNQSGQIVALDRDGREVKRYEAGTSSYSGIASDGREIVVGHQNGYVSVLGDTSHLPWAGTARWVATSMESELFRAQDAIATSGVPHGDDILYVTLNGAIMQLATSDGQFERLGNISNLEVALLPPAISGDTLLVGNQQGYIAAFDVAERRERWHAQLEGTTFSTPAVLPDRVLLASTHAGKVTAVALDLADGHELWRRDVPFDLGVGSSALLYDNRFYVVGNAIHAFDPADGSELWSENGSLKPYQITVSDAGLIAVGYDPAFTTYLATFDPASGKRTNLVSVPIDGIPNLHGGISAQGTTVLLAFSKTELAAVDATTGMLTWQTREASELGAVPVIHGNAVLYLTIDSRLIARALDDGAPLGEFSLQDSSSSVTESTAAPIIVGDQLYAVFYQQAFALSLTAPGGTR